MFVRVGFGTNTTALNAGGSFGRFGQEMAPSGCSFTERLLLLAVFTVTAGLASVITAPPISSIPLVFVADAAPRGVSI